MRGDCHLASTVKSIRPVLPDWGMVLGIGDPSGVLWRIVEI